MIKKIIFLLTTNRCKENKWTIRQHKVEGRVIGFPLWLTQSLLKDEVSAKYWIEEIKIIDYYLPPCLPLILVLGLEN